MVQEKGTGEQTPIPDRSTVRRRSSRLANTTSQPPKGADVEQKESEVVKVVEETDAQQSIGKPGEQPQTVDPVSQPRVSRLKMRPLMASRSGIPKSPTLPASSTLKTLMKSTPVHYSRKQPGGTPTLVGMQQPKAKLHRHSSPFGDEPSEKHGVMLFC